MGYTTYLPEAIPNMTVSVLLLFAVTIVVLIIFLAFRKPSRRNRPE